MPRSLVVPLRASQEAWGSDLGTADAVKIRLFSGIQVTETLLCIAEARNKKTRNITSTREPHDSGSLDEILSPSIMRTQCQSQSGTEKGERTRGGCASQQRSSRAGYVCNVHYDW
jgi:hypothetical protein